MRFARGAIALLLGALPACRPSPVPARPEPVPGQIKRYEPLAMRGDARRADQAVILGTDSANGSTVLTIPTAARFVVVEAMTWGRDGAGRSSAGMQSIVLSSAARTPEAPRPASPLHVNGADDAGGRSWRAGAWSAALVAATALGKDLGDLALEATPAGPVDGAVSALIAGGLVALVAGDAVDPTATLAGAIAPDGTIGPVAGLPEQVAAAIARGKRRIGYPAGMRVARSSATGKEVDLVQLAGARAEVIELSGVHDAAQLLIGHRLPAPVPVDATAMALDPATLARLDARYLGWQHKLAQEWAPLLELEQAGRLPATVMTMVRIAHDRRARAEAARRAGKLVAAHGDMLAAWAYGAAANQTYAVVARLAAGDVDRAEAALAALDPGDAGVRGSFAEIAAAAPATIAGHLAMIAALQAALRGWAFHELAAESLRATTQLLGDLRGKSAAELGAPATADRVATAVASAGLRLLRSAAAATLATQELELAPESSAACACAPASVMHAAQPLQAAADAAIGHLDAVVVEPLARKVGIAPDAARRQLSAIEPDYLIAAQLARSASDGLPHELAASWGDEALATSLLALAGAQGAHHSAALMLAKYESLGVHSDDTGRINGVNHPPAFRAQLAGAERAARAAAHAAQIATGAIPVQAKLAYQLAAIELAGGVDDQIDALAELWTATAFSEAAVMLARDCN